MPLSTAINFLPHCLVLVGFDLQRYFLQKYLYRLEHLVSVGASCRKAGCQLQKGRVPVAQPVCF